MGVADLPIRQAVRALIVDPDDRVLLVEFDMHGRTWFALPGGGVEEGEDEQEALRRELAEEVGLVDVELVGPIWERVHIFRDPQLFSGQAERIYFVRCATFDPTPQMTWDQLNAEGVTALGWWTEDELVAAGEAGTDFAPSRLPELARAVLADGPPTSVIDVGH